MSRGNIILPSVDRKVGHSIKSTGGNMSCSPLSVRVCACCASAQCACVCAMYHTNGSYKWFKMVQNGSKCAKMVKNGQKRQKMVKNNRLFPHHPGGKSIGCIAFL